MPKLKLARPPNPYIRDNQVNLRLSEDELKHIKYMADKYTEGNVSEYIRYAAMTLNPKDK